MSARGDQDDLHRAVWDSTAAGLCWVDAGGFILSANPSFAQSLGYRAEDLVGAPLSRLHPPDVAMSMRAMHRALIDDAPADLWLGSEMRFLHSGGRPIVGYARNARVLTADGQVRRLITLVSLTDIVRSDPRLEEVNRVENFAALASSISNDINNLLSIILGYTALLQDNAIDARRLRIVSDGVEGAVQRASSLVRQTLYLARRPQATLRPSPLNAFVEGRIESARTVLGERTMSIDLALSRTLQAVPLDAGQLGDAFDELIQRVHAIDPEGKRELRVRTLSLAGEEVRRQFSQATESRYALIEISHPGRPVSNSRAPYSATDLADSRGGQDLGLTMVERIVESHRGFLSHQMVTGGGVTFSIVLPAAGPVEAVCPGDRAERTPALGRGPIGRRVLVIDDEVGLRETLVETLNRAGYDAEGVGDGDAALRTFREREGKFDLVICDLVLPKLNGWEVFTGMREIRPDASVVIMSGHLEPKLKDAVGRSGAAGFLQKPFSMKAFMRFVREKAGPPTP